MAEKLDGGAVFQQDGVEGRVAKSDIKAVLGSISESNDRDTVGEATIDNGVTIVLGLADASQGHLNVESNSVQEFKAETVE